ncbi:hypothetical protein QYM36_012297, partial [Artemia franciscana]
GRLKDEFTVDFFLPGPSPYEVIHVNFNGKVGQGPIKAGLNDERAGSTKYGTLILVRPQTSKLTENNLRRKGVTLQGYTKRGLFCR